MKSILIVGMGRFGTHLCKNLVLQKNQIMIIDKNEDAVNELAPIVSSALVADCTKPDVVKSIGVDDFDLCFVCIGDDFQSSLEITSLLKDFGAQRVVSLSKREIDTKFLLRNGADEVIHPDKDIAESAAVKYSNDNIFDYIELEQGYSIYEISPLKSWVGKDLIESNLRAKYKISVIGIISEDGTMNIAPSPKYVIKSTDHLMVIAHKTDIKKVLKQV